LAPLWALALGLLLGPTKLGVPYFAVAGRSESALSVFSGVFTMAHLVVVFFRTHGNESVFKRHPVRFLIVPVFLFAAMAISSWALIFGFVLAVWWDVYHSALQTHGFGRYYDSKRNADRAAGARLDRGLNFLLYAGPIFAGVSLADHTVHFTRFADVGTPSLARIGGALLHHRPAWPWLLASIAAPYLLYYLWSYRRLAQKGYAVSMEKIVLFVSTALCSVWAWGFNPFGQAFFIMNFFHALQYFALVAHSERESVAGRMGLTKYEWGKAAAAIVILTAGFLYGAWAKFLGETSHWAFSVVITVSLLHFWYDSFIWSVRRSEFS
jgi:hypothetical protein